MIHFLGVRNWSGKYNLVQKIESLVEWNVHQG